MWRGERQDYPSTHSTLDRLSQLTLTEVERDFLADISERFVESLAEDEIREAEALFGEHLIHDGIERKFVARAIASAALQHYGFPTRFVDFTSDPFCALAFALSNDRDCGFVLSVDSAACEVRGLRVFDNSTNNSAGARAAQQSSFLIHLPASTDLKAPDCANAINLVSYRITATRPERIHYETLRKQLLSVPLTDLGYWLVGDLHTFVYNEVYNVRTFAFTDRVAAFLASRCLPATTFWQREAIRRLALPTLMWRPGVPKWKAAFRTFQKRMALRSRQSLQRGNPASAAFPTTCWRRGSVVQGGSLASNAF